MMTNSGWEDLDGKRRGMLLAGGAGCSGKNREADDYYATDPIAVELLLEKESFAPLVWECACGEGHLSNVLKEHGYQVLSTDLIDRKYGLVLDFLESNIRGEFDIVTNPPYAKATDFVLHALDLVGEGHKVAMLLKTTFLDGKERRAKIYESQPPKVIYVFSGRIACAKNGDFEKYRGCNAVSYAWFIWEKGFRGEPVVRWIN